MVKYLSRHLGNFQLASLGESKIERAACRLIWTHLGIKGSKLVTPGDTGYPDRIFWVPGGKPVMIEFKRPGELPTPKQLYIHNQLRALGYTVEVHSNEIRAFQAIIDAVATTRLSKEGREVLARAQQIVNPQLILRNIKKAKS